MTPESLRELVLDAFRHHPRNTLQMNTVFDHAGDYAHADVVRAIEDLEAALLVRRHTEAGEDRLTLTNGGAMHLAMTDPPARPMPRVDAKETAQWQRVTDLESPVLLRGREYRISIEGQERSDGTWAARIVFAEVDGRRRVTEQESSQPNRDAVIYWATGLEPVYLDGALDRAR
jgi:hypothetical protein